MPDIEPYLTTVLWVLAALALVIILIFALRMLTSNVKGRKGQRLGISEYHEIDKTRRLVLLRRDDVEHLVLIGGGQDLVIETGIGLPRAEGQPGTARMAPRAPVFSNRRPPLRPVEGSVEQQQPQRYPGQEPEL